MKFFYHCTFWIKIYRNNNLFCNYSSEKEMLCKIRIFFLNEQRSSEMCGFSVSYSIYSFWISYIMLCCSRPFQMALINKYLLRHHLLDICQHIYRRLCNLMEIMYLNKTSLESDTNIKQPVCLFLFVTFFWRRKVCHLFLIQAIMLSEVESVKYIST